MADIALELQEVKTEKNYTATNKVRSTKFSKNSIPLHQTTIYFINYPQEVVKQSFFLKWFGNT